VATALLVAGPTLTFWMPWQTPFASTSSSFKAQLGCSYNCRRLTYDLFQLMHMSCDDHAVQLIKFEQATAAQNEDKTFLQCSKHCHKGEFRHVSISAQQRSLQCGQNLCGPFLRATLPDRALKRWRRMGDKRAHNSTTKVSFCTIIRLCHCTIAITRV